MHFHSAAQPQMEKKDMAIEIVYMDGHTLNPAVGRERETRY